MYQTSASLDCSLYFYPHCTYITHTAAVYTMRTTYPPTHRAISPLSGSRSNLFRSFFSQQSHLIHPDLRVDLQSRCYGTEVTQVDYFFSRGNKKERGSGPTCVPVERRNRDLGCCRISLVPFSTQTPPLLVIPPSTTPRRRRRDG